jgi:hypothetical protein
MANRENWMKLAAWADGLTMSIAMSNTASAS